MKKKLLFFNILFIPLTAIAAGDDIQSLLGKIVSSIIHPFINFLLVLATLVFLWGVIQYVIAGDSSNKTEQAKRQIVWGLIGLTIMAGAKGIVGIIQASILGL